MARETHARVGKDPQAQAEFRQRHGIINADVPVGNAEALIRAHQSAQSRAVQKASLLAVDEEATAALDYGELQGQIGDDPIEAAAVRGNAIVVVARDPSGRTYKTVVPANDTYVAPQETEADRQNAAVTEAELSFQAEVARIRLEHEEQLENLRVELAQQTSDEIQKLREELGAQRQVEEPKSRRAPKAADETPEPDESPE